jgi:hypothetical protein
MTADKFQELKDKIDTLKEKKAKSKGSMDSIEKGWKEEYGFSTIEEAVSKQDELKTDIETGEKKLNKLMDKIESSVQFDEEE